VSSLLVVRFSALGDLASTAPYLSCAARTHDITLLTSPLGKNYFSDAGYIRNILELKDTRLTTLLKMIPKVFNTFDYFVDLHGNDRSRFLSHFSRGKRLSNYVKAYRNLTPESTLARYIKPGSAGQFDYFSILSMLPDYRFQPEAFEPKPRDYIVLNIGSSGKWLSKRLPLSKWQEIVQTLHERYDLPFMLTGAADEVDYIAETARSLPGKHEVVAGKTTLSELKTILRQAYLTVSTDSGPMHMSAVERTPTIGIFGPTNWIRSAPYGPWSTALFDRVRYPESVPPARSLREVDDYFSHIDIHEGLAAISDYL
jgi:ADP-heptose:LPS heptosyltransferase